VDLGEFIDVYRGPLIGLVASWGAPWHEAAEIAQDSFSQAWISRESCRGNWREPEVFGRWLRGVALNQYRNWARRRRRERARGVMLAPAILDEAAAEPEQEPEEHLELLREAIARLPAKQKQVVLMHYLEETSVREVAALLSVSAKTVEGRLYQARQTLRRWLDDRTSAAGQFFAARIVRVFLCL
jgi:RNA polymerase sigma-70 factor (ECF subfamily)